MTLNINKELKHFYSIKEVAEQFGVAESLLRYWEQVFPQLKPEKGGRNIRHYTKEHVEMVGIIYNLVKVRHIKISQAREMLSKNKSGEHNTAEVLMRLKNIREELVRMRKSVNQLNAELLPDEV